MTLPLQCLLIPALLLVASRSFTQSQQNSTPTLMIEQVTSVIESLPACHYYARMHSQFMGSDSIETRDFWISLRRNEDNLLYGYDWEIGEKYDDVSFTFMIVPGYVYRMHSGGKFISRTDMLSRFEPGSYFWTMHDYLILDEVIKSFIIGVGDIATIAEAEDAFRLTRQMNAFATLDLFFDKKSYLPIKSVSTITDGALDLKQVIAIDFTFPDNHTQLPDSAFFPDYYISKGYELKTYEAALPDSEVVEFSMDENKMSLLLSYPFVTETGDTMRLMGIKDKYMLLDFWFASCLPCLQAMPHVNQLAERYRENELQVLAVNCFDKEIKSELTTKMQAKGIAIPFLFGEKELVNSMGMRSFPTYLFITPDRDFRIITGGTKEIQTLLTETFDR